MPESIPSASGRHRVAWFTGMLLNPLTLPPTQDLVSRADFFSGNHGRTFDRHQMRQFVTQGRITTRCEVILGSHR